MPMSGTVCSQPWKATWTAHMTELLDLCSTALRLEGWQLVGM